MAGLGQIDVNKAVEVSMAAQSRRLNTLQAIKRADDTKLSLYSNINDLLTGFQTSLTAVSTALANILPTVSSSNSSVLTGTATANNLAPGSHTINITTLAQSQQSQATTTFASNGTALNLNDSLTFTSGSQSFSINVASTENLANIAQDINNASDNFGLTASIVKSVALDGVTPQYTLVIDADNSGTSNAFSISGGLASTFNFTASKPAANATFTFDGLNEVSGSNTVTDVIDGLTLNLAASSSSATINIEVDNIGTAQTVQDSINTLLNNYNSLITFLDRSSSAKETNVFQLAYIKSSLQEQLNNTFSNDGSIQTLADLGINLAPYQELVNPNNQKEYTSTGSLQVNPDTYQNEQNKLTYNLQNNLDGVIKFFNNASSGFASTINQFISSNFLDPVSGTLPTAEDATNQAKRAIDDEIVRENERLEQVKNTLIDKFSLLNAKLSIFQSISKSLEAQISFIESNSGSNKK